MTAAERRRRLSELRLSIEIWSRNLRNYQKEDRPRCLRVLRQLKRIKYELTVGIGK